MIAIRGYNNGMKYVDQALQASQNASISPGTYLKRRVISMLYMCSFASRPVGTGIANWANSIVAFKGTTNLDDIKADVDGIGINKFDHPEFEKAYNLYDKVKSRYGDNILSTGHSLGGTKAIKSAEKHNGESIVFNPGSSPLYNLNTNSKTKVYRHQNDQVSASVEEM